MSVVYIPEPDRDSMYRTVLYVDDPPQDASSSIIAVVARDVGCGQSVSSESDDGVVFLLGSMFVRGLQLRRSSPSVFRPSGASRSPSIDIPP